jgi:hypothetical protein
LWGAYLQGANLRRAKLENTILDPTNIPQGKVNLFEKLGKNWLIGYRTKNSPVIDKKHVYEIGELYEANAFSTSKTDCHPGLFVCPTIEEVLKKYKPPIIKVIFQSYDLHSTVNKHRVHWFIVWEKVKF